MENSRGAGPTSLWILTRVEIRTPERLRPDLTGLGTVLWSSTVQYFETQPIPNPIREDCSQSEPGKLVCYLAWYSSPAWCLAGPSVSRASFAPPLAEQGRETVRRCKARQGKGKKGHLLRTLAFTHSRERCRIAASVVHPTFPRHSIPRRNSFRRRSSQQAKASAARG